MKILSIIYNIVFSLLLSLGMPIATTSALTVTSLVAISVGLLIASPELAFIVAALLITAQLWLS